MLNYSVAELRLIALHEPTRNFCMNHFIAFALLIYKRLHPCFEIPF